MYDQWTVTEDGCICPMTNPHLCIGSNDEFNVVLVSLMDENTKLRFEIPNYIQKLAPQNYSSNAEKIYNFNV